MEASPAENLPPFDENPLKKNLKKIFYQERCSHTGTSGDPERIWLFTPVGHGLYRRSDAD